MAQPLPYRAAKMLTCPKMSNFFTNEFADFLNAIDLPPVTYNPHASSSGQISKNQRLLLHKLFMKGQRYVDISHNPDLLAARFVSDRLIELPDPSNPCIFNVAGNGRL